MNPSAAAAVSRTPAIDRSSNGTVPTQTNGAVASGTGRTGGGRTGNGRNGYNPYVPGRNRNNGSNYGVVYGYPFYPFSYGFNGGWYGNGYGNYYNSYPYQGYSFGQGLDYGTNGGDYNGQSSSAAVPQTTTVPQQTTATVPQTSAVAQQAQVDNAVEKSPAYISANSAVSQAQSAYNQAREQALSSLREKPDYQQALSRRYEAADAVRDAKGGTASASPTTGPAPSVVTAAEAKLQAGDEVTKMEEAAVAKDPSAIAAKARLDQAIADRDSLKAQLSAQAAQATRGG